MPQFYCKEENYYLSTNSKVMWSTLKNQNNLKKIQNANFALCKALEPFGVIRKRKHYLLVRNPYDRLESFFRDKLRKHAVPNRGWQRSQRIFFPLLGINKGTPNDDVKEKLMCLSFDTFIKYLPCLYFKDGHLHPQFWVENIGHRLFKWTITFDKVLKMEQQEDLAFLANNLKIDLQIRYNYTRDIDIEINWAEKTREIVNSIYHLDFIHYNYAQLSK